MKYSVTSNLKVYNIVSCDFTVEINKIPQYFIIYYLNIEHIICVLTIYRVIKIIDKKDMNKNGLNNFYNRYVVTPKHFQPCHYYNLWSTYVERFLII